MSRPKGTSKWMNVDYVNNSLPAGVSVVLPLPEGFNPGMSHYFIDNEFGQWKTSCREMLKIKSSTHPKRAAQKRKEYFKNNPTYHDEIRAKAVKTTKTRYSKNEMIEKQIAGNIAKFGKPWASQTEQFKNTLKQNNILKYGVENPSQSVECNKTALILPNGKLLTSYCKELNREFAKSWAKYLFHNVSPLSAQEYIQTAENESSYLETQFSKLCNMPLFNKRILKNRSFRPDFLFGKIAIDVDGLRCHSELLKSKNYHAEKRLAYLDEGYTLLQFRQDEIHFKPEIVKSIVNAKLGNITKKYYARKLKLSNAPIVETNDFFNNNHLMGASPGVKVMVLHDGTEVISAISYRKYKDGIDIVRFCNKLNVSVAGALSKFLSTIVKIESPKFIQSFVDMRYGTGDSLKTLGFECVSCSIGWKWTDGIRTFNRLQCRANMDERKLTEKEYAKELNWSKIYDAGQAKFIKFI